MPSVLIVQLITCLDGIGSNFNVRSGNLPVPSVGRIGLGVGVRENEPHSTSKPILQTGYST